MWILHTQLDTLIKENVDTKYPNLSCFFTITKIVLTLEIEQNLC